MKLSIFLTSCWLAVAGLFTSVDKTTLNGMVYDAQNGEPLIGATVQVIQNKKPVKGAVADFDGKFSMELEPGIYEVEASYTGYVAVRFPEVVVKQGENNIQFKLEPGAVLSEVVVVGYSTMAKDELHSRVYDVEGEPTPASTAPSGSARTKAKSAPSTKSPKPAPKSSERRDERSRGDYDKEAPAKMVAPMEIAVEDVAYEMAPVSGETAPREMLMKRVEGIATTPPPSTTVPAPRAGLLTAGEWNDLHNWNRHWVDLLTDGEINEYEKTYQCYPSQRYTVLLTNAEDFPVTDAYVKLSTSSGEILWETRTDNTGKAELWAGFFDKKEYTNLRAEAWVNGQKHALGQPKPAKDGINRHQIQVECNVSKKVDIVWAVDATGSMGDEIEYLKTELLDVIGRAQGHNPELEFRMGTVFYRDKGDEYITKSSGLSPDINQTVEFIRKQFAGGGGDYPEAVHSALEEAIFSQKWNDQAIARICFLVLDASPHADQPEVIASLQRSIREAARLGIRIVPVTASGIQKDTEFLMKFFGLATNGSYVFLTDHSGVGGKHLEPTTDEYKVELLNDLLVRLITEYTSIKTCEGKSSIRFEDNPEQQQQQTNPDQALYYPNPASTQFTLELPMDVESVTIYDSEGKAVRKIEQPQVGKHSVVVSDLQEGFYTIRILYAGRMQSGKLMIIRS
ncbi:MAG TPA: carboxypeptidase regulatory-like domain-containing protein [Saprospiraceae bacterium]|nr:carboxypeptidase regulatory-like domain-containing protein [Saprospiraceae bacterium]HPI04919.1 carboxypeptidase regulatory-like domain-containing protein [Saprospiraceae bacterium]